MNEVTFSDRFLGSFSDNDRGVFENKKTQVTYQKGETIIKQGALATNIVFINVGMAVAAIQSQGQKQINIRLVGAGEFIAFFSIFDDNVYPYSVIAVKETTVCMIDKQALTELMLKNPKFALEMTSRNYRRERRYLDIISSLSFKQMRGKMATALYYLSSDNFITDDVFAWLTRKDIADFASVTLESAIKFVKEFEQEGLVRLDNKKIVVLERDKLNEISRVG